MTVDQFTAAYFARQESLRCELLRSMARRASNSRERNTSEVSGSEMAPSRLVDHAGKEAEPPTSNSFGEELKESVHQPVQPPITLETEAPWEYPDRAWRKHPMVMKYSEEAWVFIPTESYPAHADAAFSLVTWLRQPGKLYRPSTKSLHSGVVRVERLGWIVTFGNLPGALDRMVLLLEWKAGQTLMFKGTKYTITMHTHIPLEWML
ncbi:glutathione s-transferase protein [Diplodia corticola]|uniref:Glutathione s-transferase protein n=1 Tax=Diplodia corticola TaxID=236234 RepID=A0A1J9RS63_9PEZI|nr:glutathione s-transferase protein [Diplodia corticola]OJD31279.1 glutathione s-transferase protein [Diplodia corticola]